MTGLEIALAVLFKVAHVAGLFAILSSMVGAISYTVYACNKSEKEEREATGDTKGWQYSQEVSMANGARRIFIPCLVVFIISMPLAMVPKPSELWELRIALIKLELASPANLEKGTAEISRIAEKLECKYLGCDKGK